MAGLWPESRLRVARDAASTVDAVAAYASTRCLNVTLTRFDISRYGSHRQTLMNTFLTLPWSSACSASATLGGRSPAPVAAAATGAGDLPPKVADALQALLQGNVKKVFISVCLWLPYLLMSKRVNVTFRHRVEN